MKYTERHLFLTAYILYIFQCVLSETTVTSYSSLNILLICIRYITLLIFVAIGIGNNFKGGKKQSLFLLLLFFIALLSFVVNGNGITILAMVAIVWAASKCPLQTVFKVTIYTLIVSHILVVFLSYAGFLKDSIGIRYIGAYLGEFLEGEFERHTYGFLVANQLPITLLFVYLLELVRKKGMINIIENALFFVLNIFLYNQCGARTIFILVFLAMAMNYAIRFKKNDNSIGRDSNAVLKSLPFLVFGILSFTLVLSYGMHTHFLKHLNLIFNNRLLFAYNAIHKYGLSIIGFGRFAGTNVEMLTSRVDNGYIIFYLQQGILIWIFTIGLLSYLMYFALKIKNECLWMVLFIISLEVFINAHLMSYRMLPLYCILLNKEDPMLNISTLDNNYIRKAFKIRL